MAKFNWHSPERNVNVLQYQTQEGREHYTWKYSIGIMEWPASNLLRALLVVLDDSRRSIIGGWDRAYFLHLMRLYQHLSGFRVSFPGVVTLTRNYGNANGNQLKKSRSDT